MAGSDTRARLSLLYVSHHSSVHARAHHPADERIQPPFTLPTSASQVRSKPTKPPTRTNSSRPAPTSNTSSGPSSGTTQLAFNTSGTLLLVRSGAAPTAVLLYDFPHAASPSSTSTRTSASAAPPEKLGVPQLRTVLLHAQPVAAARWNPDPGRAGRLAVACGSQSVYLWSDEWVAEPGPRATGEEGEGEEGEGEEEVAECVGVPARESTLSLYSCL